MFCYIGSSPTILYRIILLRLHCVYQRGTACRAYQTRHFIYGRKLGESETFFEVAVLPELLGRWFSRPPERISMNNCESLPNSVPACFETITLDSSSPTTSGANPGDIEPIPTLIVLACMELTNTASKVNVGR